jgi:ABC-type arginine/histidine transport system permease subunit
MMFTTMTGLLTVLAIVGVVLNIHKKRLCFYIWFVTNSSWAVIDFYKGIPMQGLLFVVYTGLALYGIVKWKEK